MLAERRERLAVLAALGAVYVIWGSTYYALRIALEGFPPFLLAGGRFLVAGALLYGGLRLRGERNPTRAEWWAATRVGFLLLAVGNGGVTFAEQSLGSALAAVVVATMPLWAAVFARAFGQPVARAEWIGLGIGFVGVALLNAGGDLSGGGLGAIALIVSPIAWSLGSVWSRRLPMPKGPMATACEMLTAGAILLALAAVRGEPLPTTIAARPTIALVYLVIFGSLVAFSAYMYLLQRTRPAVATSYAYVNPLVAIALGVGLGGERIAPLTWLGAAVVLTSVVLLTRGHSSPSKPRK
jgi:drug/metabolite transporter (DMT)-like permease